MVTFGQKEPPGSRRERGESHAELADARRQSVNVYGKRKISIKKFFKLP